MKILVLENPGEHTSIETAGSIYYHIESWVGLENGESELVRSVEEADSRLHKGDIDWVIIHHYNNRAVDLLRENHPNVKYAASSAWLYSKEECSEPGTMAYEFKRKVEKHYDFLLHDLDVSISKIMGTSNQTNTC